MIKNLNKDNLELIKDSFLDEKTVLNDLNTNPFAKYLILLENDKVIGYLYYSDIYERAEINQIEILEIHRNCGKASLLLGELIKNVDKDITLEVKKDNYPAVRLYEKFNFNQVAIRKGYYQGIDGILMERKKDS